MSARLWIYHAAVLSALAGPLWMPNKDARGWPVAAFVVWVLTCWLIFVWNQPRPSSWPEPPDLSSSPAQSCDHEWSERGSGDDRWQECWLCGVTCDLRLPPGQPSEWKP